MSMTSETRKQRRDELDDRAGRMCHAEEVDGETRHGQEGER
jgi:hypothetical protein